MATSPALDANAKNDSAAVATQREAAESSLTSLHDTVIPKGLHHGLYVGDGANILGFPGNNKGNGPAFCKLSGVTTALTTFSFDNHGRMIVPNYNNATITVYDAPTHPKTCGKRLGVIDDPYGQPIDAASLDAVKGRIVVANIFNVAICSLHRGCTQSFLGPQEYLTASVALAKNGDCWVESDGLSGPGVLDYFKGCSPPGQDAPGYYGDGDNFGGLDIDKHGNIVSILANYHNSPALYVYSGCKPNCTMLAGPLPLQGTGTYGRLNSDSTEFAAADSQYSRIDIYKYTPTSLTYEYSFSNDLAGADGVAYNPRASQ